MTRITKKNWQSESCWLHLWESGPKVDHIPGGMITFLT